MRYVYIYIYVCVCTCMSMLVQVELKATGKWSKWSSGLINGQGPRSQGSTFMVVPVGVSVSDVFILQLWTTTAHKWGVLSHQTI